MRRALLTLALLTTPLHAQTPPVPAASPTPSPVDSMPVEFPEDPGSIVPS